REARFTPTRQERYDLSRAGARADVVSLGMLPQGDGTLHGARPRTAGAGGEGWPGRHGALCRSEEREAQDARESHDAVSDLRRHVRPGDRESDERLVAL